MIVKTHMIRVNNKGKTIDIGSVEEIQKARAARARARQIKRSQTARQKLALKRSMPKQAPK